MLIDQLKKDNLVALKEKDNNKRAILSVVISNYNLFAIEQKAKGIETGDADAVRIIQKAIKELDDELEGFKAVGNKEKVDAILLQKKVLEAYLPKMLSEEEIKQEITKLEDKSIPSIMKHFKANFAGKCDMGLVNRIAREFN